MVRDKSRWLLAGLICLGFMAAACSTNDAAVSPEVATVNQDDEYRFRTGDQLRITVLGHEDLSVELEVDSAGRIVGNNLLGVDRSLVGLTCDEIERLVLSALQRDYLNNPQVSVECIRYRPCYIIGEVANSFRSCRCEPGMRVIDLLTMCPGNYGGFTYRAMEDEYVIMRDGKAIRGGPETLVMPGDVIELQERFF